MEKFKVCGQLVGSCENCISSECFYVQFLTGHWTCIDHLAGWRDIVRVIAPNFPEMCANVREFAGISATSSPAIVNGDNSWLVLLGCVQVGTILVMSVLFWILFSRDQRLVTAIERIPIQIQELYRQQNAQRDPIAPMGAPNENGIFSDDDDDDGDGRNMNPFLPLPISGASAAPHQEIEMEEPGRFEDEEYSSSEDESPEVMPQDGWITKFGRMIHRPNFLRF